MIPGYGDQIQASTANERILVSSETSEVNWLVIYQKRRVVPLQGSNADRLAVYVWLGHVRNEHFYLRMGKTS